MNIQENSLQARLRDSLVHKLKPKEREITEKIKGALKGQPLEEVLRRLGNNNKDPGFISEEDLVIGVSKLNANLHMGDLKDFISALKTATGSHDNKFSLAETI